MLSNIEKKPLPDNTLIQNTFDMKALLHYFLPFLQDRIVLRKVMKTSFASISVNKILECKIHDVSTSISINFQKSPEYDESDKHLEARDRRYSCLKFVLLCLKHPTTAALGVLLCTFKSTIIAMI